MNKINLCHEEEIIIFVSLPLQCISAVAFVKNETDILEQPCWVMLINIVAMDMLKSKIPPGEIILAVNL